MAALCDPHWPRRAAVEGIVVGHLVRPLATVGATGVDAPLDEAQHDIDRKPDGQEPGQSGATKEDQRSPNWPRTRVRASGVASPRSPWRDRTRYPPSCYGPRVLPHGRRTGAVRR
jgi:hypothetical protein